MLCVVPVSPASPVLSPSQLNVSYPATGCQKLFEFDDEKKTRIFNEKRMGQEVEADSLGDEWKGYVLRIAGGNDKQGFPMKQGVLTNSKCACCPSRRSCVGDLFDYCATSIIIMYHFKLKLVSFCDGSLFSPSLCFSAVLSVTQYGCLHTMIINSSSFGSIPPSALYHQFALKLIATTTTQVCSF